MIVDALGRRFRNLRVSLTAACNYACTYCVPNGKRLQAATHELEAEEMTRAVKLLMDAAGIDRLRITGGEPMLTPKFDTFLPEVMKLGLKDVSVTTNGQFVLRKLDTLLGSGLKRINVSLDTLNADRFRSIARSGDLATVLGGLAVLKDAGLKIKVNMVPMKTANADQILPMLDYCLENGFELRFIELMQMGHLKTSQAFQRDFIGMADILEAIGERYEFSRTDAPYDATAVRYEIPGAGTFGIIANESEPFCAACTRLRLSSNGHLYGCLSSAASHDMQPVLALPEPQALANLQSILVRALGDKQRNTFTGEVTVMKFIGG
ncbi:MAG: radical SAM protein [Gammaproteobacteria bacterium]|nr:MAG: radical SAM protein [Gammaproteobacteria bacterium]